MVNIIQNIESEYLQLCYLTLLVLLRLGEHVETCPLLSLRVGYREFFSTTRLQH